MDQDETTQQDLRERLRIMAKENELLAERAEEIALLGLVAEQMEQDREPRDLLASVLERICILKGIPYGACLEGRGPVLTPLAAYHARRPEGLHGQDRFTLEGATPWPPTRARCGDGLSSGLGFAGMDLVAPGLAPTALAVVPLQSTPEGVRCFLFADDRRTQADLDPMLPVLERVADLVRAKLVHLSLISALTVLTRNLDQKVAERTRDLERSQARYRVLFEHVPDGILLVDAASDGRFGRIEDANAVAADLYGYSLEELRSMDVEALNAPGPGPGLEGFEARVWRLREGETVREEQVQRRKDGSTFPVEAIGTLVRVHDHPYVLGFFRDLTERKLAEQLLLAAQRTESLGVLAGGIAHDFNNLLTAIIGQTGIALDKLGEGLEPREHLDRVLEAAERAALLTRQMLAYSGRGKFSLQSLPINLVIQENLGILEAAIPKKVQVELDLEAGMPTVVGDPSQLQQVVMNLVLNGVQAIGEAAGRVVVRTRTVRLGDAEGALWPLGQAHLVPGDYVRIDVQDTGCGMSPLVRSRIFEPFFSTKERGHGLGLSAVQGIIRGHRGGLGVDSAEGEGTTFRVLLPAGIPEVPMPEAAAPAAAQAQKAKVVLVIDDEDYMLEVVRDILEAGGHRAVLATSGEEGLEVVRRQGAELDFVLLDLSMPGIGGMATLREIRLMDPGLPVVLTSGFAEEEVVAQLHGVALSGFLQKPYRVRTLMDLVEAVPARNTFNI